MGEQCFTQKTWTIKCVVSRCGIPLHKPFVREATGLPKQHRLLWLFSKTLLLPTPLLGCVTKRKSELTWKFSFVWPAFTAPAGILQVTGEGRSSGLTQQWILHAVRVTSQANCAHWHNSARPVKGVTNCFLVGFEACSKEGNLCLLL